MLAKLLTECGATLAPRFIYVPYARQEQSARQRCVAEY